LSDPAKIAKTAGVDKQKLDEAFEYVLRPVSGRLPLFPAHLGRDTNSAWPARKPLFGTSDNSRRCKPSPVRARRDRLPANVSLAAPEDVTYAFTSFTLNTEAKELTRDRH
jgi:hypothetical protein